MVNCLLKNNYRNVVDTTLISDLVCHMVAILTSNKDNDCAESILKDDDFLEDTVDTPRRY